MKDVDNRHVAVTPSVLYSNNSAIVGIDGGEGGFIHVRADGMCPDQYADGGYVDCFKYKIYGTDGEVLTVATTEVEGATDWLPFEEHQHAASGNPVGDIVGITSAIVTFLAACAESSEDGENYNLFPSEIREWAQLYSDELAMIAFELEEEGDLLR